ncbi:MAG TPA: SUMF1/EgtB/PvdO family nonheme iron enzyme [Edaphocola sp.]|nr:SUMF1/EgtB/PvdO family nonheme iron enzyme [Edaphocola sp.]
MCFVFIEAAGEPFTFQENDGSGFMNGEKPQKIKFKNDFYLCAYPCTQEFWELVVSASGTKELKSNHSNFKGATRPVEKVSWDDIQIFNQLLNNLLRQGKVTCKLGCDEETLGNDFKIEGTYTLPSEVQWDIKTLLP